VQPIRQEPLSARDIRQLDRFLLADESLEEAMDVSTLDGFLCAVLSGPKLIMPSEWMRWIWDMENGEQVREFRSEKEAQRILSLLMRHANDIADTLTYAPEAYEPLFFEHTVEGGTVSVVDEWCCGYVKGISLDPDGWQPLLAAQPDWFEVVHLYGTEHGWARLKDLVDRHAGSNARHQACVDQIAPAARRIHAYWLARRTGSAGKASHRGPQLPIRTPSLPLRNEPCPCGSGKKFKRCHGAPETPH
jgi:uncharacterized protein